MKKSFIPLMCWVQFIYMFTRPIKWSWSQSLVKENAFSPGSPSASQWNEAVLGYMTLNNESLAEVEINDQESLSKYVTLIWEILTGFFSGSGSLTIPHNEDGSKSITIWARILNVADQGALTGFSGTVTLTNIPRETSSHRFSKS